MTNPNRKTASTPLIGLALGLALVGPIQSLAWASMIEDGGASPSRTAPQVSFDTLASLSTEAAARDLRDLSAAPGTARAAGLVAWAEDRLDLWRTAKAPDDIRRHRLEVEAALESLRALNGPVDLGMDQLTVLFLPEGESAPNDPAAGATLGALAALLETPGLRARITGYATPEEVPLSASPRAVDLALERARQVAWRLRALGIAPERLTLSAQVSLAPDVEGVNMDGLAAIKDDPLPDPRGHRVDILVEDPPLALVSPPTQTGGTLQVAKRPRTVTTPSP